MKTILGLTRKLIVALIKLITVKTQLYFLRLQKV